MNTGEQIVVTCCFCGEPILAEYATRLTIVPPVSDGGEQILYCHGTHLRDAIIDDIVLIGGVVQDEAD